MKMRGRPALGEAKIVNFSDFTAPLKLKRGFEDLASTTGIEKHVFFREALETYLRTNNIEFFLERENAEVAKHNDNIKRLHEGIGAQKQACRAHAEALLNKNLREMLHTRQAITKSIRDRLVGVVVERSRADRAEVDRMFGEIYGRLKDKY